MIYAKKKKNIVSVFQFYCGEFFVYTEVNIISSFHIASSFQYDQQWMSQNDDMLRYDFEILVQNSWNNVSFHLCEQWTIIVIFNEHGLIECVSNCFYISLLLLMIIYYLNNAAYKLTQMIEHYSPAHCSFFYKVAILSLPILERLFSLIGCRHCASTGHAKHIHCNRIQFVMNTINRKKWLKTRSATSNEQVISDVLRGRTFPFGTWAFHTKTEII